jgi:5-formyltetrahydrofolate cyclo-ligase
MKPETKSDFRGLYTTVRSFIGSEYAEKASQTLVKRVHSAIAIQEDMVVAGYIPVHGEINILPLLESCIAKNVGCTLPVITSSDKPMEFRSWKPGDPLQQNSYAIGEPEKSAATLVPDIIFTPLLSCDRQGTRIGYGKGFYDRTIAFLRKTEKKPVIVGICFHVQLSDDKLPCDENDQKLDIIITEKQTIVC